MLLAGIGAAALGFARHAEAQPAVKPPTVGLVHSSFASLIPMLITWLHEGLDQSGFPNAANLAIEGRAADGHPDRLPRLVADLVTRRVAAILAVGGSEPARVAKAATSTIPIVFVSGGDPVRAGLVKSLSHPGANVTGVALIGSILEPKRLQILGQLVPAPALIGVLLNPQYPDVDMQRRELLAAANAMGRRIQIATASTATEIDAAVESLAQHGVKALLFAQAPLFTAERAQLVALAARFRLPALHHQREYVDAGGLASYGTSLKYAYHQAGIMLGKILQGARPADLPVLQPTQIELVINLRAAKAIGLTVATSVLATADEVIE